MNDGDIDKIMDEINGSRNGFIESFNLPNIERSKKQIPILDRGPDNKLPTLGQYVPITNEDNGTTKKVLSDDQKVRYKQEIKKVILRMRKVKGKKKKRQITLLRILSDFGEHKGSDMSFINLRQLVSNTRPILNAIGLTIVNKKRIDRLESVYFLEER